MLSVLETIILLVENKILLCFDQAGMISSRNSPEDVKI